jgi:hypothetical protein
LQSTVGESNYQLLAIGRNLNQIAKRLNQGLPETSLAKEINQLRQVMNEHVDQVNKAMRASLDRWSIH